MTPTLNGAEDQTVYCAPDVHVCVRANNSLKMFISNQTIKQTTSIRQVASLITFYARFFQMSSLLSL